MGLVFLIQNKCWFRQNLRGDLHEEEISVEQMVVVKQAELGVPVAEVIRKVVGISEQRFYRWKKQYVDMETDQARR